MKRIIIALLVILLAIVLLITYSIIKYNNAKIDTLDKIAEFINTMSIEEKVGQMFMVRCPKDNAEQLITTYNLGGYILFARDFKDKTKEEVINNIISYQKAATIPMLIGVDEEGGTVTRISKYPVFRNEPFDSPQEIYAQNGFGGIIADTIEKSRFLKELGINVNFAPVADVSTNPNDYIYKRSFGQNAKMTAEFVKAVVSTMKESKIASVLKHFPGYGSNVDTHTGISIDTRDYSNFQENDFLPFISGINNGADIVLVSHNIVTSMDQDNPASLSKNVHDILRKELKFNGVIITDDLRMDAINEYIDNDVAAIKAIQAGNDLICTTDFETQIPAVIKAVKDGIISEKQINESVYRILKLKSNLGLFKI